MGLLAGAVPAAADRLAPPAARGVDGCRRAGHVAGRCRRCRHSAPAELMRDPSNRRAAWDDLRLLRATLDADAAPAVQLTSVRRRSAMRPPPSIDGTVKLPEGIGHDAGEGGPDDLAKAERAGHQSEARRGSPVARARACTSPSAVRPMKVPPTRIAARNTPVTRRPGDTGQHTTGLDHACQGEGRRNAEACRDPMSTGRPMAPRPRRTRPRSRAPGHWSPACCGRW